VRFGEIAASHPMGRFNDPHPDLWMLVSSQE
jgi:hypothetical protein